MVKSAADKARELNALRLGRRFVLRLPVLVGLSGASALGTSPAYAAAILAVRLWPARDYTRGPLTQPSGEGRDGKHRQPLEKIMSRNVLVIESNEFMRTVLYDRAWTYFLFTRRTIKFKRPGVFGANFFVCFSVDEFLFCWKWIFGTLFTEECFFLGIII